VLLGKWHERLEEIGEVEEAREVGRERGEGKGEKKKERINTIQNSKVQPPHFSREQTGFSPQERKMKGWRMR